MSPRLALDNYYVSITSLVAGVFILMYCVSLYHQAKKTKLLEYFLLTMSMVFLWLISKLLKTASPNVEIRWFFIVTQYLGICLLNYYFVQFSWIFAYDQPMDKGRRLLFLSPMLFSFIMIATNPLHMLFYSKYDLFRDSFGPLFYPHQALSYFYLVYGVYLCTREYKNSFYLKHLQSRIFAIAICVPIVINILYVAKILKRVFGIRLPMDITPLAAMISLGLFSYAIKRYRFLDITPYAYEKALNHADKAIGVFDLKGQLQDANEKFKLYLNHSPSDRLEKNDEAHVLASFEATNFKHQHYDLKDKKGNFMGIVHEWIDQSHIQEGIETLESNNLAIQEINEQLRIQGKKLKEMERIQTANRISRDLHDVLGNTLVLTKASLELIEPGSVVNSEQNLLLLEKAKNLMAAGIEEIAAMVKSSSGPVSGVHTDLMTQLSGLSSQFEGTPVHLQINFCNPLHPSLEAKAHEIYAIVRESVTNAIRHGDAQDIYVLYMQSQDASELHIIDNGKGSEAFQKGMGLKGMEERAALIGGTILCHNISEGGFKVTLSLPHRSFSK